MGVMDNAHVLPDDLEQCQQRLLASIKQAAELERVLDQTAASHEELKAAHEATIVELNRLKQWVFGRRSERIVDADRITGTTTMYCLRRRSATVAVAPRIALEKMRQRSLTTFRPS
jgi:hypothetical protein